MIHVVIVTLQIYDVFQIKLSTKFKQDDVKIIKISDNVNNL